MSTVTVLPGPERRRRWTTAEKLRIVEESLNAGPSVVEFARQRDLHPNLVHTWRWPTCATCSRESPLTRSIVSTSCCPGIGVRAADDAHAPKRGALRRKPSLDQTTELINLPINEQTSRARDPNSRRGSPDDLFVIEVVLASWLSTFIQPS